MSERRKWVIQTEEEEEYDPFADLSIVVPIDIDNITQAVQCLLHDDLNIRIQCVNLLAKYMQMCPRYIMSKFNENHIRVLTEMINIEECFPTALMIFLKMSAKSEFPFPVDVIRLISPYLKKEIEIESTENILVLVGNLVSRDPIYFQVGLDLIPDILRIDVQNDSRIQKLKSWTLSQFMKFENPVYGNDILEFLGSNINTGNEKTDRNSLFGYFNALNWFTNLNVFIERFMVMENVYRLMMCSVNWKTIEMCLSFLERYLKNTTYGIPVGDFAVAISRIFSLRFVDKIQVFEHCICVLSICILTRENSVYVIFQTFGQIGIQNILSTQIFQVQLMFFKFLCEVAQGCVFALLRIPSNEFAELMKQVIECGETEILWIALKTINKIINCMSSETWTIEFLKVIDQPQGVIDQINGELTDDQPDELLKEFDVCVEAVSQILKS